MTFLMRVLPIAVPAALLVLGVWGAGSGAGKRFSFDLGEGFFDFVGGIFEDPAAAVFMLAIGFCLWMAINLLKHIGQSLFRRPSRVSRGHQL
jgi:hypothetical protein